MSAPFLLFFLLLLPARQWIRQQKTKALIL